MRFYFYVYNLERKVNADVFHVHSLQVLPLGVLLKFIKKKKLVYDVHEVTEYFGHNIHPNLGKWVTSIEKKLIKSCDGILVATDGLENRYKSWTENKTQVTALLNCLDPISELGNKSLSDNHLILGRIGSLRPKSRFDILAKAIKKLNDDGYKTKFIYAGTAVSGYEETRLEYHKLIEEYSTYYDWVPLSGFEDFYSKVNAIINIHETSNERLDRYVNFSKVFEAAAHGVPCIINDFPSMAPIVRDHQLGIVVDEVSVQAFYEALKRVHTNIPMLGKMSKNAYGYVDNNVKWSIMEVKLLDFYSKI